MKISYNWLKDYIKPVPSPEETAEILTSIGLEVESVEEFESVKGGLKGVVVGEVITCMKHPNADKLSITTVNTGNGNPVQIVCGAPNVAAGQKVPVALSGTTLFKGSESFTLSKTKIRGEVSEGMICAEDELGLGTNHDGIMVLDPSAIPGTPAGEYFNIVNDYVFEIGLTPNRIDAASHYGVARDLAAYLGQRMPVSLIKPSVDIFKPDNPVLQIPVEITNKDACYRYSGLTISGIKIKESPAWLKNKLTAIGLKPINNVVDITNFVMLETGQPLHAFDAAKITGKKVIVRTMPEGTKFTCLDNQEKELSSTDLMICNTVEGMCIAGVFGGLDSGIKDETTDLFLESACFSPVFVRRTSRRHLLFTDSSFRFERGSDPNATIYALKRAALLIRELAGGIISSEVVDIYPEIIPEKIISLSYRNLDRLIGQSIGKEKVISILKSLEIKIIKETTEGAEVSIPTYRVDVLREADVIEEILRIYGYNNIEISKHLVSSLSYTVKPEKETITNMISDLLSSNGFLEIMSNSLTRSSYYEDEKDSNKELVRIYNPLSSDLNSLRMTLLYGGLEAILNNANQKSTSLRLYEFGNIYRKSAQNSDNPLDKYRESERLSLFITGEENDANWAAPSVRSNFFQLKAYVELVLKRSGFDMDHIISKTTSEPFLSEGLEYSLQGRRLVYFGKLKNSLVHKFDIKNEVFFADFDWKLLLIEGSKNKTVFRELPKYPEVKRDLSMILEKSVKFEQVKNISFKAEKHLLREVLLFDVYEGEKIEAGKKSYAVSFTLRDDKKTLTDKEINKIMDSIANMLVNELGAQIRS